MRVNDKTLIAADGWKESSSSPDVPQLLSEEFGRMRLLAGDLRLMHDFGAVGPVECPIAYDPARRLAFRYVCAAGFQRSDFSQLRAFSINARETFSVQDLLPNQWALWFLDWMAGSDSKPGKLFGLMATDRPVQNQVVIEHRLFSYQPGDEMLQYRPLCRDAYKPIAYSRNRQELIFAGADGIYLLSTRGERLLTLPSDSLASGQGADFCPDGSPKVVIGGDGLHLWNLDGNFCRRLTRNGRHPVWSPDGAGLWYRESSGDLCYYDMGKDESHKVIGFADQKHPDFWHARAVAFSGTGRFLAVCLTQKTLRGVSQKGSATGHRERIYQHEPRLCILDLETRSYWSREGFAEQLRWVG